MAKLSASLEQRLRTASPGELIEIVLEVEDAPRPATLPATRSARYEALEQNFQSATESIASAIKTAGGTVLKHTWLGSAIKASVPAEVVASLLSLDGVTLVDLPGRITR